MSNVYTIFKNETISNKGSFFGWLIGIGITFLLIMLMYPGDEGMASMLNLLEDEFFQAFLGDIGGSDPGYALWIAMMFPFISMILFIYSINSGVKIATQDTDKGTSEIIFSVPVSRRSFYFAKWFTMVFYTLAIILAIIIALGIPITGSSIEMDKLLLLFIYTVIFNLSGISLGILLGLITGSGEKGSQIALLSVLGLYTLQSVGRLQEDIDVLNKINVFALFDPLPIILQAKGDTNSLFVLSVIAIIGLGIGLIGFENKDLIKNRGISFGNYQSRVQPILDFVKSIFRPIGKYRTKVQPILNFVKSVFRLIGQFFNLLGSVILSLIIWIRYRGNVPDENSTFHFQRTTRTSIFTFWARPLEKKYPITADFIYSERRILLIVFWAIVTVYPLQLAIYPGDELTLETIKAFGSGGIFDLFTYGHDLNNDPYLWYVITQAIGGHWIFFLPLVFHWVKKITVSDAEKGTGEILGSQPISYKSIIFQRIIAIMLELIFIVSTMIMFLIMSEAITGSTAGLMWEIIAILVIVPFYSFWTALLISIALSFKSSGVKVARAIYFLSFLSFAAAILNENFNYWYTKGIFGLYDPVIIIQEKSMYSNNGSIFVILILSILSPIILAFSSRYYSWSLYDQSRGTSTLNETVSVSSSTSIGRQSSCPKCGTTQIVELDQIYCIECGGNL